MKVDFDSADLVLCVCLWGGFVTGFWIPAISVVVVWYLSNKITGK